VVLGAGSDRGGHRVRARIARHGREGASLQAFGGTFFTPEAIAVGIALVVGIDRIMSEGRALTNCIGNGVATMVVAKWQGERDDERFQAVLDNPSLADPDRIEDEPEPSTPEAGRFEREPVPALA
jgi:aerobic C4-dicarboxylate transport protein